MMTVKAVSRRTGVSTRTLQYYDKIGLLKATTYTEAGYRLYDESALERLQQILLLRELEFPLTDIREILGRPDFDRDRALRQQIELLELKKQHIEGLISLARGLKLDGGTYMDFSAFDRSKLDAYAKAAKESWGHTAAYKEFTEKHNSRTAETERSLGAGLIGIFSELGRIRHTDPADREAQTLVKKLQAYITENYYNCTKEILFGLGQMYAAGGEFTENIDAVGGPGTALFVRAALAVYCK